MTYKIWIDENGVPKWNPKFNEGYGDSVKKTEERWEKAKLGAVEFEGKKLIYGIVYECYKQNFEILFHHNIPEGFYNIEIDGRIAIDIRNGKAIIIPL